MKHKGTTPLYTSRLILRPFKESDAKPMFEHWAKDPAVTKYLRWPPHASIKVTESIVMDWVNQYQNKNFYQWAITIKEYGDQPIGTISVVDQKEELDLVHIGYCIGKKWWGKGITTEAFKEVIRFLFEEVQVRRIESQHDPHNIGSGKVMEHCGLQQEGILRQADVNNQGICDACMHAILACDYEEQKSK